jgi:dethiobiotin synthetase
MTQYYFITGTDTGVGKTYVTTRLLEHFQQQGLRTISLKPLASGCEQTRLGLRNDDAVQLQQTASIKLPYEQVNPFAYEPAIAPHIAANNTLTANQLVKSLQWIKDTPADVVLIEGAGGWLLPLNEKETMADVVRALNIPVMLVVGLKLGCLNHAALTYHHLQSTQTPFAGWIANSLGATMEAQKENVNTLTQIFGRPALYCF